MIELFNSVASVIGYFFTTLICVSVLISLFYWIRKAANILVNKIKANSNKIVYNGYVYKLSYKYVEYDCFMFTAYKDWYFVIKRYPEYPLNYRFDKRHIMYLSTHDDNFVPYDYCKGYGLHKYESIDEAKTKLHDVLEQIKNE